MMLLQRLAESGCFSDECGSGTCGPIASSTPGAPGPGSALAASHFPASDYSRVAGASPPHASGEGLASAASLCSEAPLHHAAATSCCSWYNTCPAGLAPLRAAPSQQEEGVRGARTAVSGRLVHSAAQFSLDKHLDRSDQTCS